LLLLLPDEDLEPLFPEDDLALLLPEEDLVELPLLNERVEEDRLPLEPLLKELELFERPGVE